MSLTNCKVGRKNNVHLHGDMTIVFVVYLHLTDRQHLHHCGNGLTHSINDKVVISYKKGEERVCDSIGRYASKSKYVSMH